MQSDLDQIDSGPLEELTRLKGELDTLDSRLETMEQKRGEVAEAVYARVRADYEARRAALEEQAAPLKAAAREQYARLHALLSRSDADHEAARLDREEIEFRHSLGEFDDSEYQRRIAAIDEQLAARSAAREQAQALRKRFIDAFRSEDELLQTTLRAPILPPEAASAPPAEPPAPPAAEAATRRLPTLDPAQAGGDAPTVAMPLPPAADLGATQTMKVLKGDVAKAPRADQTVMIRSARLLPKNAAAGKQPHTVGLRPLTFGSGDDCDVRIAGAAAKQAQIRAGMAGFTVTDLGGGVRVNGVAIEQHLLRHDDQVEIGPARFAFSET